MNIQSNTMPESSFDGQSGAPAAVSAARLAYWSIRRELWENRSIYIAPLVVAGVALLAFLFTLSYLPANVRKLAALEATRQHTLLSIPYDASAIVIILVSVLVGLYYSLEALHSERRDRSILFWKSLPVSDLTTVLSKAIVPLIVMPLLAFAIIVALQLIMLLLSTVVLLSSGANAAAPWTQRPMFEMSLVLLYGLATLAVWYAPIYGWLLLVSAWAQRATLLWAVLPPLLISVGERLVFHTSYFGSMLKSRLFGGFAQAFVAKAHDSGAVLGESGNAAARRLTSDQLAQILNPIPDPVKFLSTPGVWIGLVVAAALLAGAVWLRRHREPM